MPKKLTELTVFISSPSDMSGERTLIERALEKISQDTQATHGVLLKALRWERDVVPGLGDGAQSVIDSQIGKNYDIYIGLLGTYFGTPTAKFSSGTEDEYRAAYERYVAKPEDLRVLFYFKTSTEDVFSIDTEQFQKVVTFKDDIKKTAFFGTFSNQDDLLKKLTNHLQVLIAQQWDGSKWKVLSPISSHCSVTTESFKVDAEPPVVVSDDNANEMGEEGLLELLALGAEFSTRITEIMEGMTTDATAFQSAIANRATDLEAARTLNDTQKQIRSYDRMAEDMMNYEKRLKFMVPQLSIALDGSLETYLKLRSIIASEIPQMKIEFESAGASFYRLSAVVRQSRDGVNTLRDMIADIPPFTKHLRTAKQRLAGAFDTYIASATIFLSRFEVSVGPISSPGE